MLAFDETCSACRNSLPHGKHVRDGCLACFDGHEHYDHDDYLREARGIIASDTHVDRPWTGEPLDTAGMDGRPMQERLDGWPFLQVCSHWRDFQSWELEHNVVLLGWGPDGPRKESA